MQLTVGRTAENRGLNRISVKVVYSVYLQQLPVSITFSSAVWPERGK